MTSRSALHHGLPACMQVGILHIIVVTGAEAAYAHSPEALDWQPSPGGPLARNLTTCRTALHVDGGVLALDMRGQPPRIEPDISSFAPVR